MVAHRDAAPMKRLGMSSSSHMDAGGASADSTRETSAVVGLHPQRFRSEMSSRGAVLVRFSTGARLSRQRGAWLTTERAKGRAPGRAGSVKLGQTGGNTSSRHRMGHVELPDPGHKLRGVSVTSIYAHARQPFVFGRVSGDHFNARKTAQNREFPAAALPVGPAPGPVMGGRAAEPASRGSG